MGAMEGLNFINVKQLSDLSWAAGFIDGDGCIGIARQTFKSRETVSHRLKLTITQNDREVLEDVENILGEPCFIAKLKRDSSSNRQAYALVYDSAHALRAIKKLRPFLRRKKYEAEVAEKMWKEGKMGKHPGRKGWPQEIYDIRESWAQKMSRLK